MVEDPASIAFIEFSREKLLVQYWPGLCKCLESLSNEQVWWRPNEASNSIGNLLLHLNGNVQQWLVSSFQGRMDSRERSAEFKESNGIPVVDLLERLDSTLKEAGDVLASLSKADLLATIQIQGYTVNGLQAVYHVVEHFGMHYGQIVYITKMMLGEDLGFYRELDRTGRLGD